MGIINQLTTADTTLCVPATADTTLCVPAHDVHKGNEVDSAIAESSSSSLQHDF